MSNEPFASEPEMDIRPPLIETPCRARVGKVKRALCQLSLLLIPLLTTGCASQTLFSSNFDTTPINQPPAHAQAVGTATVDGGVAVAAIPDTNTKGARFSRISSSPLAVLHCDLAKAPGDGTYQFSTIIFYPSGAGGLVTIQFEKAGGAQSFLHLDLFPGGSVRIDDDPHSIFGHFPLDQVFFVQVTLKINASPTAHIVLSGANTSGEADRTINPASIATARQFGAVELSMNLAADESRFFATNIVVQYDP